jgi:hypothetical protein
LGLFIRAAQFYNQIMNLRRFSFFPGARLRRVLLGLILVFVTACSVYKSSGRNSFESKTPGNLRTSSLASGAALEDEGVSAHADTCWNQPSQEPLWHIDPNVSLSVSPLNNEEIQVCILDL